MIYYALYIWSHRRDNQTALQFSIAKTINEIDFVAYAVRKQRSAESRNGNISKN